DTESVANRACLCRAKHRAPGSCEPHKFCLRGPQFRVVEKCLLTTHRFISYAVKVAYSETAKSRFLRERHAAGWRNRRGGGPHEREGQKTGDTFPRQAMIGRP